MFRINFCLDIIQKEDIIIDLPKMPKIGESYYLNINGSCYEAKVICIDKYVEIKNNKTEFCYLVHCTTRAIHPGVLPFHIDI